MAAYSTVMVGTDGSKSSFAAVERAAEVAADTGAKLVLVCAFHKMSDRERKAAEEELGDLGYKVEGSHPADDILSDARGKAEKAGAKDVSTVAKEGQPVDILLDVARDNNVDLVVVGNKGLSSLSGRLLGSVPSNISAKAACDVLIVHTTSGR